MYILALLFRAEFPLDNVAEIFRASLLCHFVCFVQVEAAEVHNLQIVHIITSLVIYVKRIIKNC